MVTCEHPATPHTTYTGLGPVGAVGRSAAVSSPTVTPLTDHRAHVTLYQGDARAVLRALPEQSVHCVVTSPPYWGLRNYGVEPTVWGGDPACGHAWRATSGLRRNDLGGGQ